MFSMYTVKNMGEKMDISSMLARETLENTGFLRVHAEKYRKLWNDIAFGILIRWQTLDKHTLEVFKNTFSKPVLKKSCIGAGKRKNPKNPKNPKRKSTKFTVSLGGFGPGPRTPCFAQSLSLVGASEGLGGNHPLATPPPLPAFLSSFCSYLGWRPENPSSSRRAGSQG